MPTDMGNRSWLFKFVGFPSRRWEIYIPFSYLLIFRPTLLYPEPDIKYSVSENFHFTGSKVAREKTFQLAKVDFNLFIVVEVLSLYTTLVVQNGEAMSAQREVILNTSEVRNLDIVSPFHLHVRLGNFFGGDFISKSVRLLNTVNWVFLKKKEGRIHHFGLVLERN